MLAFLAFQLVFPSSSGGLHRASCRRLQNRPHPDTLLSRPPLRHSRLSLQRDLDRVLPFATWPSATFSSGQRSGTSSLPLFKVALTAPAHPDYYSPASMRLRA